jgi:hypothetical protein
MFIGRGGELISTFCWLWQILVEAQIGGAGVDAIIIKMEFCAL